MLPETHENYQIMAARTEMYIVAEIFIFHVRHLISQKCIQIKQENKILANIQWKLPEMRIKIV